MTLRQRILVAVMVIGTAILFALGWWQKERLDWKTGWLAEIEAAADSPPIRSAGELQTLLDRGEPVDFRRFEFSAQALPGAPAFRLFRPGDDGVLRWQVFKPVAVGRQVYFAGLETLEDDETAGATVPERITGYIRRYRPEDLRGGPMSANDNRFYRFNQNFVWSESLARSGIGASPLIALDTVDGAVDADTLPPHSPDIANNHLQYMITWWSFAVILLVVGAVLYRREGRSESSDA